MSKNYENVNESSKKVNEGSAADTLYAMYKNKKKNKIPKEFRAGIEAGKRLEKLSRERNKYRKRDESKEENMKKEINECDNMTPEAKAQRSKNEKNLLYAKKQDMVISEKEIDEEMNQNALDTKPEFDYTKGKDGKSMEDPNASIKSQKDKSSNENDARIPKDAIMRLMKSPANVKNFFKKASANKDAMDIIKEMVAMLENEPEEMKKYLGESTFYLLKTTIASQTHMTKKLVNENLDIDEEYYWSMGIKNKNK